MPVIRRPTLWKVYLNPNRNNNALHKWMRQFVTCIIVQSHVKINTSLFISLPEAIMSIFNQPDFLTIREFDVENKIILPTKALYTQLNVQFNTLYENIRTILTEMHSSLSVMGKAFYDNPVETVSAWYDQVTYSTGNLYADAQNYVMPIYQDTEQFIQTFWANPEQVTLTTLEPIKRLATTSSAQYLQPFLDNPEQFLISVLAPATDFITVVNDSVEAILISSYYALLDLFKLLMDQPSEALRAIYQNSLSALLDGYYQVISSLLTMM